MTTAINHQCPRCHAAYPTPALLGASLLCESCGHRWTARVGSDEYLPGDSGATKAVPAPLTSRRLPSDDNRIPINRSDADVVETEHGTNPSSDTSMRPSTDTSDGRIGCPVCGHAFLGQPGIDDQSCPQCGTIFSRTSGRLSASGSVDAGDRKSVV